MFYSFYETSSNSPKKTYPRKTGTAIKYKDRTKKHFLSFGVIFKSLSIRLKYFSAQNAETATLQIDFQFLQLAELKSSCVFSRFFRARKFEHSMNE